MRKFAKTFLTVMVVVLSLLTVILSCTACLSQNASGGYSSCCEITSESKKWILENFSRYETPEELFEGMVLFALRNFTYKNNGYFLIQTADFDKFIREDEFCGVCFEFAVFAKTVALVWAEEKGVDLSAHLCNVWYFKNGKRQGHSYNYFQYGGKTYYLDLTADLDSYTKGRFDKVFGAVDCKTSMKEFNKKLYPRSYSTFI